ncbi:MAG: glycosyltransferase [Clostridium sp.]|nr:glycosyltransferase [Clostridium sp.]MCM1547034.1 glycosyltransferase [Ruminococcus sp.]
MMPDVSVVIPAYNCAKTLKTAVESAVLQNVPLEIIIIDDASADETPDIMKKCKAELSSDNINIELIFNKRNQGVAVSRNIGVSRAKAEYVAFLDSDDWWSCGKLSKQLEIMKKNNAILCSTGREFANNDGTLTGHIVGIHEVISYRRLLYGNCINCSSVLVKTEIAKEFPMGHDECHEDYITWLMILKKYGNACGINEPLLKYRRSEGAKTENKFRSAKMHYNSLRYAGIGRLKALWYFCFYAVSGVIKHYIRS